MIKSKLNYSSILIFLIITLFNFVIYLIGILTNDSFYIKLLFLLGVLLDIVMLIKVKNVTILLIIVFSMILMDLYFSFYLLINIPISEPIYEQYFTNDNILKYILAVNLFKTSFCCFLKGKLEFIPIRLRVKKYNSDIAFATLYIIALILTIFGFKGNIIFLHSESYVAYIENLKNISGLPEYLTLLYFILWLFTTKKYQTYLLLILFIVMFLKLFLYGLRVALLMYMLLFYIIYFDKYYKFYESLAFLIFGYIFSLLLGYLKDNPNLISLIENFDFLYLISGYESFILSHFTNVITSSLVILKEMSIKDSLLSLLGAFINIFLPPRITTYLIPQAQPTVYVFNNITNIPGGIYFPISFFIWLGFLGPIILGIFLSFIVNKTFDKTNNNYYLVYYFIIIIITSPRWIFYTQIDYLFRFFIIFLFIISIFNAVMLISKRNKKEVNKNE